MRRNARALILIALLIVASGLALGFQTISLGGFQRGGDTLLGLSLGLDLQGGSHLVYQVEPVSGDDASEADRPQQEDLTALQRIIEERVNSSGLGEPIIQILGDDRLLIQLPGVGDPGRAKRLIGETARLEFKHRKINVERDLTTEGVITAADIVSVTAEPFPEELAPDAGEDDTQAEPTPNPDETPASETSADATPEADATPAPEASADAAPEAEAEEPPAPVIIIEFTPQGAAKFDEVIARLNESLQLVAFNVPPSSLTIAINGNEPLEIDASRSPSPSFRIPTAICSCIRSRRRILTPKAPITTTLRARRAP